MFSYNRHYNAFCSQNADLSLAITSEIPLKPQNQNPYRTWSRQYILREEVGEIFNNTLVQYHIRIVHLLLKRVYFDISSFFDYVRSCKNMIAKWYGFID